MDHQRVRSDPVPTVVALCLIVMALAVAPAWAGSNGKARGHNAVVASSPCTVDGGVVTGSGLPSGELINFMLTDASGTTGWVLGFTPDGTWSVNIPVATSPTTYEFVSRTYGPNGSKYDVFQSCSV